MNKLKEMRKKANLTQVDVAERLNITQGAISQWEVGETLPSVAILPNIAELYGCSIDELLKSPQ